MMLYPPYLFVLCMERLGHLIRNVVGSRRWKPIKMSWYGPLISYLFFADDLVLFAFASLEQGEVIMECLNTFSTSSGQKIIKQKSSI